MILEGWYTGGTEEYVAQLSRYLAGNSAWESHLVILGGHQEKHLTKALGSATAVYCIDKPLRASLVALRRIVRRIKPEVCHCHLYTKLLPVTLLLRALRVPRLVTTLHVPLTQWNLRHRTMWRAAAALAHQLVGVSTDVLISLGRIDAGRYHGEHVVPPPFSAPVPTSPPGPRVESPTFTVTGCGRLAVQKDWPTMLRALAGFRSLVDKPVRFVHFGDGPLEDDFRATVAALGIQDCVEMMGRVAHDEVLAAVSRSDLFVLPSIFEGLGMAALEAMQCGVPTVTADFGSSYDFIKHGVTGHQFRRGDWEQLRDLLLWHHDHPGQSREIGRRGQQFVLERFSEENTFGQYLDIYADRARHVASPPLVSHTLQVTHRQQGCQLS